MGCLGKRRKKTKENKKNERKKEKENSGWLAEEGGGGTSNIEVCVRSSNFELPNFEVGTLKSGFEVWRGKKKGEKKQKKTNKKKTQKKTVGVWRGGGGEHRTLKFVFEVRTSNFEVGTWNPDFKVPISNFNRNSEVWLRSLAWKKGEKNKRKQIKNGRKKKKKKAVGGWRGGGGEHRTLKSVFEVRTSNFEVGTLNPNFKVPTSNFEVGTLKSGFEVWRGKNGEKKTKENKKTEEKKEKRKQWVAGGGGGGEYRTLKSVFKVPTSNFEV